MKRLEENKSYTRYEVAKALDMPATDLSNIRRELKKEGYEFSSSGRGNTYLIEIHKAPDISLIWFAKTFFNINIKPNRVDDFAQFLHYIFTTGNINYPYSYITTKTNYSENTISNYISAIRPKAFRNTGEDIYLCIRYRNWQKLIPEDPKYLCEIKREKLIKKISKGEYDFANRAYWQYYDYNKDGRNPESAEYYKNENALIKDAIGSKLLALGGWYPLPRKVDKYAIKEDWRPLKLLLSLLEDYKYNEITRYETLFVEDTPNQWIYFKEEEPEDIMDNELEEENKIIIYTTPDIYFPDEDMYLTDALEYIRETKQYKKLEE